MPASVHVGQRSWLRRASTPTSEVASNSQRTVGSRGGGPCVNKRIILGLEPRDLDSEPSQLIVLGAHGGRSVCSGVGRGGTLAKSRSRSSTPSSQGTVENQSDFRRSGSIRGQRLLLRPTSSSPRTSKIHATKERSEGASTPDVIDPSPASSPIPSPFSAACFLGSKTRVAACFEFDRQFKGQQKLVFVVNPTMSKDITRERLVARVGVSDKA